MLNMNMNGYFINNVWVAIIIVSCHSYSFLRIRGGMTTIETYFYFIAYHMMKPQPKSARLKKCTLYN